MLLQFILSIGARTVNLSTLPILNEFKEQCQPKWGFVDSPFKLSQLIAVFRHGNRAPLKMGGSQWKDKQCKSCSSGCTTTRCEQGMLTLNGFEQAKELGHFVSKFYVSKFSSLRGIQGFHSKIGRTFTTLNGVILGIGLPSFQIRMEASLINNPNSTQVKSILSNQSKLGTGITSQGRYYTYDNMVTSMCSDVPFDCSDSSCRPEKIYNLMKSQESQFIASIEKTRTNLAANGVSLGKFGGFLEEVLSDRDNIVLISGHDSTLIKLLIGLGIKLDKIPAYSSAVFLEVWKQPSGKEFVRVVYNGKTQKVGLYGEEYVEIDKFIAYLAMFNKLNDVLSDNTDINSESIKSPHKLNEIAKSATRTYKPLITELKNRDIIQDSSLIGEEAAEASKTSLTKTLKSLVAPMKQFLFGGWFGGSKKDKDSKVKMKVEMEDKDTGKTKYQIIECDKDGKGNCRAVSNDGNNKKGKSVKPDRLDSDRSGECKPKIEEPCTCRTSKPCKSEMKKKTDCCCDNKKTDKCGVEKDLVSQSCQTKTMQENSCSIEETPCKTKTMQENSCSIEETPCKTKKAPCEFESTSAFDGLPGTCKMFSNRNCEALNPPISPIPCAKKLPPTLPDGSCRNPIPGVEILG